MIDPDSAGTAAPGLDRPDAEPLALYLQTLGGGDFWNRVSNFDSGTAIAVAAAVMRLDAWKQQAAA